MGDLHRLRREILPTASDREHEGDYTLLQGNDFVDTLCIMLLIVSSRTATLRNEIAEKFQDRKKKHGFARMKTTMLPRFFRHRIGGLTRNSTRSLDASR